MNNLKCLPALIFISGTIGFLEMNLNAQEKKITDLRGKMTPWNEGAWIYIHCLLR